jgi:2-hydroxy-6-oxonona-2,4-dienedioate hydrolase
MSLVQTVLGHAQRVEMPMPWGRVVWHVWRTRRTTAAKPCVLFHGGSGSWTHWVNNVLALSQEREVWALDMPGFGDSDLPAGVKDADDLVPYVAQILTETFHKTPVDVVGFSFGGMTAGLMAAQHPNLVSNLILVGVPGLGLMVENLPMRGMLDSMTDAQRRAVHRHNLNAMMLSNAACVTEDLIDLQMNNVDRDRMRRRRIARTDVLAKVQTQWQCPVHGIWGGADALYVKTLARVPEVLHTLSSFKVIPDAGHWVQFENPEAFHDALEKTL